MVRSATANYAQSIAIWLTLNFLSFFLAHFSSNSNRVSINIKKGQWNWQYDEYTIIHIIHIIMPLWASIMGMNNARIESTGMTTKIKMPMPMPMSLLLMTMMMITIDWINERFFDCFNNSININSDAMRKTFICWNGKKSCLESNARNLSASN